MTCDTATGPMWPGATPDSRGIHASRTTLQDIRWPWLTGSEVLRRLVAREHDLLAPHLLRLHAGDRRQRFCGQVNDERILRYANSCNSSLDERVGFFVDGDLRGCGELYLFLGGGTKNEAEFALSLESPWQNQGIGTRMLSWLIVLARNRCVLTLHMHCLADNLPMRSLARSFAIRQSVRQGVVEGTARLAQPDAWSATCELSINSVTWAHRLMRRPAPRRRPAPAP